MELRIGTLLPSRKWVSRVKKIKHGVNVGCTRLARMATDSPRQLDLKMNESQHGGAFMCRPVVPVLAIVLILCGALLLGMNSCGGGGAANKTAPPTFSSPIQHVVVIFQENRTPDNLFNDPVLISRGADIASSGVNSLGHTIPLIPGPLANTYDLDHSHKAFVSTYDNGKMDGADKIPCTLQPAVPSPRRMFAEVSAASRPPRRPSR